MKHTLEWEKHNGAVPEGCIVTFANGDTLDWSVDNLVLTTTACRKEPFGDTQL